MTGHEINGFIVVRKPEYAGLFFEDGWLPDPSVCNGKKYYGIERGGWEDLKDAYYTSRLDPQIKNIYERIKNSKKEAVMAMRLIRNLEEAKIVLEFSNQRNGGLCELVAFESEILTSIQGKFETQSKINWIGYDVFQIGGWSLIRHGVFRCDQFFSRWADKLNDYGLLPKRDTTMLSELIKDYNFFEEEDLVEEVGNYENIDFFRVGIVNE